MIPLDTIIYWVRSTGPHGKDRVPMYFKGCWRRHCEDGARGDIRARPQSLGEGEFTATYGRYDFEREDGAPITDADLRS